jgi:hypothetical protein
MKILITEKQLKRIKGEMEEALGEVRRRRIV